MEIVLTVVGLVLGIAIVVGIIIAGGVTWGVRRFRKWDAERHFVDKLRTRADELRHSPAVRQLTGESPYRYLATDGSATQGEIILVVQPMLCDPTLGTHAKKVIDSLQKADFHAEAIDGNLEHEFGRTSLTWERFHSPVAEALGKLRILAAKMANQMQVFDSGEYRRLSSASGEGDLASLQVTLDDIGRMGETCDELVNGLGSLHLELDQLRETHEGGESEALLEELKTLTEQTKLYA